MSKILINLSIPAIADSCDIWIPDFLEVRALIPMLANVVTEHSAGRYTSSGQEFLCYVEKNQVLEGTSRIQDCGIQNGDHLMLF